MGAVETANYIQAAGTFAGVDPPPAPIPASGVVAQQGFTSFTRNGVGDYTLGLELAIGFLEAEVRVQPGVNQLVVIGGQVDPDTERVQVRCYDTLGNPADCQVFTVQVLKIAVGPAGQLPLPGPPVPIAVGGALCLVQSGPGNVQAVVGSNMLVIPGTHTGVTAPANPADCDEFGVTFQPGGPTPRPSVPIVSSGGEFFFPNGEDNVRILAGTMIFQFEAAQNAWYIVSSPVLQAGGDGSSIAFGEFASVTGAITQGLIDWLTGADTTTNRWLVRVYVTDSVSGDIAQFYLHATFGRDGASVVTQKVVTAIDSVAQGTVALVTVQFSIVAQTVTLEITGVVGRTLRVLTVGELHEYIS